MFVRRVDDLNGTDKEMLVERSDGRLQARRLLTKEDGCGFSVSDVRLSAGMSNDLWYKNHVEGNLMVSGEMEITELSSGDSWTLGAGDLYVVGPRDRHRATAKTDCHIVSVFCPPTLGTERHDADGSYPPTGEIPPAWQGENGRTMFAKRLSETRVVGISHGRTKAYRYLTHDDECGFTISTPRAPAGQGIVLWYQNHVEANYIFEGEGTLEEKNTGKKWEVGPGTLYVVGPKDPHQLTSSTGFYLMSVFNPPIYGGETHDDQGGYPPTGPIPEAWRP